MIFLPTLGHSKNLKTGSHKGRKMYDKQFIGEEKKKMMNNGNGKLGQAGSVLHDTTSHI